MYINKPRTPKDELTDLLEINKKMLQNEGIIYLPDMYFLKTREIDTALFQDNMQCGEHLIKLFREKLYPFVSNYQYRAEMRLFYEQFSVFQGLLPLIDEVLFLFFAHKYISAYISLCPIVEGLLLRWAGKLKNTENFNFYKFIKEKTQKNIKANPEDMWRGHNFKLLEFIVCDFFFRHSDNSTIETMFNRNVTLHLLNNPEYIQSQKNCMRLFTILDLIANCLIYEYPLECGRIGNVSCYKYQEEGQNKISELAGQFYTLDIVSEKISFLLKHLNS